MRFLNRLIGWVFFLALVVAGVAVWWASQYVDVEVDGDDAVATVTLAEEDVNRLVRNAAAEQLDTGGLLEEVTRVDLKPGGVEVEGIYRAPSGERELGTFLLALAALDGKVSAQVTEVKIEGFDVTSPAVQAINDLIAAKITEKASIERAKVTELTTTEDELRVVVRARWSP